MEILVPIGRVLFSIIFIMSGIGHFTKRDLMVGYAEMMKVPVPGFTVPFTGMMIILGGFSVMVGYHARVGALLLFIFLVPTAFIMHRFWGLTDQEMAQTQQVMFIKNISMAGAALIISYFGSGPYSLN